MADLSFATRLLRWFDEHGRHDLPWQLDPSAYRVWVSEIMLQQTQVKTVIGYYTRFMARFPDVRSLADASIDDVLHHWSGLGYYARARNLHAAAILICEQHNENLPREREALEALPGIGRSTAGAILSLSYGERHAILDGNVKRVLARHAGVHGWPGSARIAAALWALSESHTPSERVAEYTQAIMDLGATLCVRRTPRCDDCPVASDCIAKRDGKQAALPESKPKKAMPVRQARWVIARNRQNQILVERRPPTGLWGGLYGLPECPDGKCISAWCAKQLDLEVTSTVTLTPFRHTFSHFHLDIEPILVEVAGNKGAHASEGEAFAWITPDDPTPLGFAAPVLRLLGELPPRQ